MSSSSKKKAFRELTPECETQNAADSSMPTISKTRYLLAYDNFMLWKNNENVHSLSEDVFLAYFNELAIKYKPSTLWAIYSMLKTTIRIKNGIDMNTYSSLFASLKRRSNGFHSKKSKVLSLNDVEKFLKEAPDKRYLLTKVALIFALTGSCKRRELYNITTKDIEHHGKVLLVKTTNSRTKKPRIFAIHGQFYEIVKKYEALRAPNAKTDRFFQIYQKGKCIRQHIGVNKFDSMPREIAHFLKLPDADSYTGNCFRSTALAMQTGVKLDRLMLMGQEWVPYLDEDSNVEGLIQNDPEDSNQNETDGSNKSETEDLIQMEIEDMIQNEIEDSAHSNDTEPPEKKFCPESTPTSTSYYNITNNNDEETYIFENCSPPTFSQDPISETINNNLTQTVRMPSKTIVYTFKNCTFTNCFKK